MPLNQLKSAPGTATWPKSSGSLLLVLLASSLLSLTACRSPHDAPTLQRFEFTSPHMGTLFSITLYASNSIAAQSAAESAFKRVAALEDIMSDYQADSELMRLCDHPFGTPVPVSGDLFAVLSLSLEYSRRSDGAFDVTVGPFVRLWRFSRKRGSLPTSEELLAARAAVGWRKLALDRRARTVTLLVPSMRLDLGGIGKGYAADEAMKILRSHGIDRALVAASGDIAIGAPPPAERGWRVAVAARNPLATNSPTTVLLHHAGISTSGDTEQFVEIGGVRYSHIVDPQTGLGLTTRLQATIIGPNATTTDALDTTVSVLGVRRGLALVDALPRTAGLVLTDGSDRPLTFTSKRWRSFPFTHGL